ncbi:hypothetical protein [Halostella salina]|uniref:hypothetical protein n=1 Tax=Halostella salina TaxID=1547897 RepID=UPI000EF838BE|nr:hypothetical protein [Halostella salina]
MTERLVAERDFEAAVAVGALLAAAAVLEGEALSVPWLAVGVVLGPLSTAVRRPLDDPRYRFGVTVVGVLWVAGVAVFASVGAMLWLAVGMLVGTAALGAGERVIGRD